MNFFKKYWYYILLFFAFICIIYFIYLFCSKLWDKFLVYSDNYFFVEIQIDPSTTIYGKYCSSAWGGISCVGFDGTIYPSPQSYIWRSKDYYNSIINKSSD